MVIELETCGHHIGKPWKLHPFDHAGSSRTCKGLELVGKEESALLPISLVDRLMQVWSFNVVWLVLVLGVSVGVVVIVIVMMVVVVVVVVVSWNITYIHLQYQYLHLQVSTRTSGHLKFFAADDQDPSGCSSTPLSGTPIALGAPDLLRSWAKRIQNKCDVQHDATWFRQIYLPLTTKSYNINAEQT